jgi:5-(carboxyamino)imidazole ribonucleotide mutase
MHGWALQGMDAVLSMVQMPAGIPVGTLAVGRAGAVNAALLAGAVIALGDPEVATALDRRRAEQTAAVPERPSDSA